MKFCDCAYRKFRFEAPIPKFPEQSGQPAPFDIAISLAVASDLLVQHKHLICVSDFWQQHLIQSRIQIDYKMEYVHCISQQLWANERKEISDK